MLDCLGVTKINCLAYLECKISVFIPPPRKHSFVLRILLFCALYFYSAGIAATGLSDAYRKTQLQQNAVYWWLRRPGLLMDINSEMVDPVRCQQRRGPRRDQGVCQIARYSSTRQSVALLSVGPVSICRPLAMSSRVINLLRTSASIKQIHSAMI